jgi:G3E family GTPase
MFFFFSDTTPYKSPQIQSVISEHIKNVKERVIFQGIHMLFECTPDREWRADETRKSEIVIIGRNLDADWFHNKFQACIEE